MKKSILFFTFFILALHAVAQYEESESRHFIRVEAGYLKYLARTVTVKPGAGWKGYHLPENENGMNFNAMWGWDFNESNLLSVGAGYLNFEGIEGADIFTEIDFMVSNSYVNPYLGLRGGYTHLWNQYENGTGSVLAEFIVGLQFRFGMYSYSSVHLQSGISFTQQALFIPVRLSYQF